MLYTQKDKDAQYRVQMKRALRLNGISSSVINNLFTNELETLYTKIVGKDL
jgi:hypothetical protein